MLSTANASRTNTRPGRATTTRRKAGSRSRMRGSSPTRSWNSRPAKPKSKSSAPVGEGLDALQVAGVVVACEDQAAGAVADDLGDAAVRDVERARPVGVEADHDVAKGADDAAVRHRHGRATHGAELAQGCLQPRVKRVPALFAGERGPPAGGKRRRRRESA